ncbi:MAG TPA: NnrS family protein, partial [Thermopetrobacter sp.]|nr:NnrS family protein [Thermopetrobacter sp.]
KRAGEPESAWPVSAAPLERVALALSLLLPLTVLAGLPDGVAGSLALVVGLVHAARLARWRARWALRQPILIALHLGFGMLGLGMILWGLAQLGLGSEVAALHVLGIGAVGGMTLAVMSRAALGHTGRDLVAPAPVAAGYWLMVLATVLRWLGSNGPGAWYFPATLGAAALWSLALVLYLVAMWPVLTGPRRAD